MFERWFGFKRFQRSVLISTPRRPPAYSALPCHRPARAMAVYLSRDLLCSGKQKGPIVRHRAGAGNEAVSTLVARSWLIPVSDGADTRFAISSVRRY